MEIPICLSNDFDKMSNLLNKCYYTILSKDVAGNVSVSTPNVVRPNKGQLAKIRSDKFSGGTSTKDDITNSLNAIQTINEGGKYLFLFKLDISESNKYNNSQIFNDICKGSTIGEGDYVMSKGMLGTTYYIVKKTEFDDKNNSLICFIKPIDVNNFEEKAGDNIITKTADELQPIEISTSSPFFGQIGKIIGYKPITTKVMIPLNPIKFINGIVINLDDFNKIINTYNPVIFDFLNKLTDYVIQKYGKDGEVLSNLLKQNIESKTLNKLLISLMIKSEYGIFGNTSQSSGVSQLNNVITSKDDALPKQVYLKIFLQIIYKIIYSVGNNSEPIYKRAKITNMRNNNCSLIVYGNEITQNNDMTIFENDYNQMISTNASIINSYSSIFMEYENAISFIIKYFQNTEIGNYTNCDVINYYNIFKNDLLTLLTINNNQKLYVKLKESDKLETMAKKFTNIPNVFKKEPSQNQTKVPSPPPPNTSSSPPNTSSPPTDTSSPPTDTSSPPTDTSSPPTSTIEKQPEVLSPTSKSPPKFRERYVRERGGGNYHKTKRNKIKKNKTNKRNKKY
jgi:hypothetical protein